MALFFPKNPVLNTVQIKIGSNMLKAEVASTSAERAKGLSGRPSIASDSGMLFVFDSPGKYQFWMKNMKFPIDMIFVSQGQVVDLLKDVPAPSPNQKDADLAHYQPVADIDMVLEVESGYVDKHNIVKGDSLSLVK